MKMTVNDYTIKNIVDISHKATVKYRINFVHLTRTYLQCISNYAKQKNTMC